MIPLPDRNTIPAIGSPERDAQERECYERSLELIHKNDGRLGDVLFDLREELYGVLHLRDYPQTTRDYARALCEHVEQCWATAIVR